MEFLILVQIIFSFDTGNSQSQIIDNQPMRSREQLVEEFKLALPVNVAVDSMNRLIEPYIYYIYRTKHW